MDGNRRFGRKVLGNGLLGHERGAATFRTLCQWALDRKLKNVTVYAWSKENWKRTRSEQTKLFDIAAAMCEDLKKTNPVKNVRFRVIFTCREGFPDHILKMADDLMEETKHVDNLTMNILFGYGGHEEIVLAARKLAGKVSKGELKIEDITEKKLAENLQIQEPLDCIVRTSGEQRLSGFLPWQSAYAELIFLPKLWPELTHADFDDVIREFSRRKRRFGK